MKVAQIIIGPAGCGKSTFANQMGLHLRDCQRTVSMVNLDPAAEHFRYTPDIDIRELVSVGDVMEDDELNFGPNCALIFCFEFLMNNIQWLIERLELIDSEYIIIDCPGQMELYTHLRIFQSVIRSITDYKICALYMIDSQFMIDPYKFVAGSLSSLSSMVLLETPHINVLTKMDLLDEETKDKVEDLITGNISDKLESINDAFPDKFCKLNREISLVVDSFSLTGFYTLNYQEENSLEDLLLMIDTATQYGEDQDIKDKAFDVYNL